MLAVPVEPSNCAPPPEPPSAPFNPGNAPPRPPPAAIIVSKTELEPFAIAEYAGVPLLPPAPTVTV
jgi:hypothetical protein